MSEEALDYGILVALNRSGMQPVDTKVLLKPDEVEEKTSGGIYIPETTRRDEQMAQIKARLIAMGGNAFEDWREPMPRIGQKVYVAKYAGVMVKGDDGNWYQVAHDIDIIAIVEE